MPRKYGHGETGAIPIAVLFVAWLALARLAVVAAGAPQAARTIETMINRDRTYKSFFMVRFLLVIGFEIQNHRQWVKNNICESHLLLSGFLIQ